MISFKCVDFLFRKSNISTNTLFLLLHHNACCLRYIHFDQDVIVIILGCFCSNLVLTWISVILRDTCLFGRVVSTVGMEASEDDEEEASNACDCVLHSLDLPAYYNPATNAVMRVPYHTHRVTGIPGANVICPGIYVMPTNINHGPVDVYGVPSFIHKSLYMVPFEGAIAVSFNIWQDANRLPAGSSCWLYQDKDLDNTRSVTIGEGSGGTIAEGAAAEGAAEITAVEKRAGKRSTDEKAVSTFRTEESGEIPEAAFATWTT